MEMKIAVAGTGYVGLVTGVCLASKGHEVTCVDVDENKVKIMKNGDSPIYEPGLSELMKEHKNNLVFTTDYEEAYREAEVIFIGVGTPEKQDGSANLSYVFEVAKQIAQTVQRDCVVVIKSTVPIGTNDKIESYIRDKQKNKDVCIYVASNPEFLSQGTAVKDTLCASRIVIGVEEVFPGEVLKKVYEKFDVPKLIVKRRSAEMIKYASNDFLALKISYINEIANLCEIVGANIEEVTEGMGYDARIGHRFLNAGIGYGGSCFPKDVKALIKTAEKNGYPMRVLKAVEEVNEAQKSILFEKLLKHYNGDLKGKQIALWGLAFKPETDDMREAPALVLIDKLIEAGASVKVYDPIAMDECKRRIGDKVVYATDMYDAVLDADALLLVTEWKEFRMPSWGVLKKTMKKAVVIDGRNIYEKSELQELEIVYACVGR